MTKSHKPYAIIVGVDSLQGVQAVRILAAHDIPLIGIIRNPSHFGSQTRLCEKLLLTNTKTYEVVECLLELGSTLTDKAVLYPATDISVLLISQHRDKLSKWFHIALPAPDVVDMLARKDSFYRFAQKEDLLIAPTRFLKSRTDAMAAANELTYPVVLKPVAKTPEWEANSDKKVHQALNKDDFMDLYDKYCASSNGLIAQEWIPGEDSNLYSCNWYCNDEAEPLATFIAHKLRQWPPAVGSSSLREECRNDAVLDATLKLVEKVSYFGLGYAEFKYDKRTEQNYFIEVNVGRPTGGSAISEAGGVELLYTMYCDLVGMPLPEKRTQTYQGVRWIHLAEDTQSAWHSFTQGQITFREWMQSWSGKKHFAIASFRDPGPFLHQVQVAIRGTFKALSNRFSR